MHLFKNPFSYVALLGAVASAHTACSAGTGITSNTGGSGVGAQPGDGDIGDGDLVVGDGDIGDGDIGIGDGDNPVSTNSGAFQAEPVVVDGFDMAQMAAFADPNAFTPGAICVYEPHLSDDKGAGALYPMNWLRPRFRWTGAGTAWEIRLSAQSQVNDLVVYTSTTEWTMPKEMWELIADGVYDDITVTIRNSAGEGMSGTFRITPALAGGSMVFWGTTGSEVSPGASSLYGFTMGDEAVLDTLAAEQVTGIDRVYNAKGTDLRGEIDAGGEGDYVAGFEIGAPRCIGCHTATPDGKGMIFTDDYPWNMGIASVEQGTTGALPDYVTPQATQFLKMPFLGTGMMLPVAWDTGDRTLITTRGRRSDATPAYVYINYGYDSPPTWEPDVHDLIWIDLQTTLTVSDTLPAATGDVTGEVAPYSEHYTGPERVEEAADRGAEILAAEGQAWGTIVTETMSISNPSPARTIPRIVYSVSESSFDGHPDWHNNTADIKFVDLALPPRGPANGTPLPGASDPAYLEYYPAFSPDDQWIAFTRAPAPSNTSRCAEGKPRVRTGDQADKCVNPTDLGANPDGPYYNRNGEIYIVSSAGGDPHRLRGNDPVSCSGEVSPGVINSWPKWSSTAREVNGKFYYFVIFSSARGYDGQFNLTPTGTTPPIDTRSSQLYMSVVELDPATGALTSYAPIYLWNQRFLATGPNAYVELQTANLTPVWEDFTIPEVPPVTVIR